LRNRALKTLVYVIIGFLVLVALGALLKFALGLLFWLGLMAIIGGICVAVVRGWARDRTLNAGPSARQERKIDREADRALKDIEKKLHP
jgi:hypothetical protein